MTTQLKLTSEQREELADHLSIAAFYMAMCWDALRQAEGIVGTEIETDNNMFQFICSDVDVPAVPPTIDDETLDAFLGEL